MVKKMKVSNVYGRNQRMIELSGQLIRDVHKQNYYNTIQKQKELVICMSEWMRDLPAEQAYFGEHVTGLREDDFGMFLHELLDAQEQKDYILYADIVETQLLPFLLELQDMIVEKEGILYPEEKIKKTEAFLKKTGRLHEILTKIPRPDAEEYRVLPARSGAFTLQMNEKGKSYFLHSNVDPVLEAIILAEEYFDCDSEHYIVYGLGLGYHIAAINKKCAASARIDVYESDLNVIKLAQICGLPEEMLTENVHIHHDLDCSEIAKAMQEEKSILFLHYPSVRNIRNSDIRTSFDKFIAKESGIRNNKDRMYINFKENCKHCAHYVDELKDDFFGKDVYLVAAGPSLDKNVELLKKRGKNSLILSVGTTYHKLMDSGIRPDFVIFLDPGERTYGHIQGLENEQIPILVASTAYSRIAEKYKGPVYMICQAGYEPAEILAEENHFMVYQTGGSVSTIAIDVAVRLGAGKIICLGLDLAYTDHLSHAVGTMDCKVCDMRPEYRVRAFYGGTVETSNLFLIYREWIEKRIRQEKKCLFINATEGGAFIEGMQHMTLQEAMKGKKA